MRGERLSDLDVLERAARMLEEQKRYESKNPDSKLDLAALEKLKAQLQERLAKQKVRWENTAEIKKRIEGINRAIEAENTTLKLTDGQRGGPAVFRTPFSAAELPAASVLRSAAPPQP